MLRTIDPFRELEKLAESAFSPSGPHVAYDLVRHEDRFEVFVDLPGVNPTSIDLTIDGRDLTLTAERTFDVPEDATVVRSGRSHGEYTRTFHLGDRLDTEGLTADYDAGVLTIVIPVAASAQPRKVTVAVGSAADAEDSVVVSTTESELVE